MSPLYSHPREYRKKLLANYLCIGFVPGGIATVAKDVPSELAIGLVLRSYYLT